MTTIPAHTQIKNIIFYEMQRNKKNKKDAHTHAHARDAHGTHGSRV